MGNYLSVFSESVPSAPMIKRSDPPFNVVVHAAIRRRKVGTGSWTYFSVHEGFDYPKTIEELQSSMWLWIRKLQLSNNFISIDLENFHRGVGGDCTRGNVLYNVCFPSTPKIDLFSRIPMTNQTSFAGFIDGNKAVKDDLHYINHSEHSDKIKNYKVVSMYK